MPRLVFFDFDRTLTTEDTIWPLVQALAAPRGDGRLRVARMAWHLATLGRGLSTNHGFKQAFARVLLKGQRVSWAVAVAEEFHDRHLQERINEPVLKRLMAHDEARDRVCLVSSNFEFFLRPLGSRWPIAEILATEAEVRGPVFTGRLRSQACEGPEKLVRVLDTFGAEPVARAVGYGDSRGDLELLEAVGNGYWVSGPTIRPAHRRTQSDL